MTPGGFATRRPGRLRPDASRVIAQLFVPGHAIPERGEGRPSGVIEHVLGLDDGEVERALAEIMERFALRHRNLAGMFRHHADRIRNRLEPESRLDEPRWLLLGASFTQEFAVEAASLCNPSVVAHHDQTGVAVGSVRFVMSVRQIGEGHRSTLGLRTGCIDGEGAITVDEPGPFTSVGVVEAAVLDAAALRDGTEATAWVLDGLGDSFTIDELDARLAQLETQQDTRRNVAGTVQHLRDLAARSYTASFPDTATIDERVLHPATSFEVNGIEDARFVRFIDGDDMTFYATCTAYDGRSIVQQLLETDDFATFTSSPLRGAAAENKGLALFPRRIDGLYAALSRFDGARNAIAFSDDIRRWPTATPFHSPAEPWESIQVGNCGPPIETDRGWLVLTHGVGPMRTYSIGAWLLDLDDPSTIVGRLRTPLLSPTADEQDGYVPNVVYSCGSLVHGDHLMIPFGIGDASIGFATASMREILDAME